MITSLKWDLKIFELRSKLSISNFSCWLISRQAKARHACVSIKDAASQVLVDNGTLDRDTSSLHDSDGHVDPPPLPS